MVSTALVSHIAVAKYGAFNALTVKCNLPVKRAGQPADPGA